MKKYISFLKDSRTKYAIRRYYLEVLKGYELQFILSRLMLDHGIDLEDVEAIEAEIKKNPDIADSRDDSNYLGKKSLIRFLADYDSGFGDTEKSRSKIEDWVIEETFNWERMMIGEVADYRYSLKNSK